MVFVIQTYFVELPFITSDPILQYDKFILVSKRSYLSFFNTVNDNLYVCICRCTKSEINLPGVIFVSVVSNTKVIFDVISRGYMNKLSMHVYVGRNGDGNID